VCDAGAVVHVHAVPAQPRVLHEDLHCRFDFKNFNLVIILLYFYLEVGTAQIPSAALNVDVTLRGKSEPAGL
jgi:hypothetical protein